MGAVRRFYTADLVDVAEKGGDDKHLSPPAIPQDPLQVGDGRRHGDLVCDDYFTNHVILIVR